MKICFRLGLVTAALLTTACSTSQPSQPREQDAPVVANHLLTPPLAEVFPYDSQIDAMRVKFPILINEETILGPGAVLRFVYNKSSGSPSSPGFFAPDRGTNSDSGQAGTYRERRLRADSSNQNGSGGWPNGNLTSDQAASIVVKKQGQAYNELELKNTAWIDQFLYMEAFESAEMNATTLVYSLPPDSRPLAATLAFPGGILVGETHGHVEVLGLNETSSPYLDGMRAGDSILSIDNQGPVATLRDYLRFYTAAKTRAGAAGAATIPVQFRAAASGRVMTTQIALPVPASH